MPRLPRSSPHLPAVYGSLPFLSLFPRGRVELWGRCSRPRRLSRTGSRHRSRSCTIDRGRSGLRRYRIRNCRLGRMCQLCPPGCRHHEYFLHEIVLQTKNRSGSQRCRGSCCTPGLVRSEGGSRDPRRCDILSPRAEFGRENSAIPRRS